MEIYTQMLDIFTPGNVIYIGEEHHPFTIERTRWKQDLLLLKFEEINEWLAQRRRRSAELLRAAGTKEP